MKTRKKTNENSFWYLLVEDEMGDYSRDGNRYSLLECEEVSGPDDSDLSEFVECQDLTQAIEYFKLIEDPQEDDYDRHKRLQEEKRKS